ncbi:MAG: Panacea domain-containing protein [Thermodesulfobacteriota bacterium]
MIYFEFNEKKATQVAALFLKKSGGKMNYMKLIKLLYLADRKSLEYWERPLTTDSYYSMEHGPILSKVLDWINNGERLGEETYWHGFISGPSNYEISLLAEAEMEDDELSRREKDLIGSIFEEYKTKDQWEMVDICHEILPEWEDPGRTSLQIDIKDIFRALGKTEIEIAAIEDEISNLQYAKKLLSA